jgi:tetratricopeptide (TPR) repeat protein
LAASFSNRALVHLKLKNYDLCIQDCNSTLALDPNYLKAYHRRGKANQELKNYEEALKDFEFIMEKEK